MAEGALAGVAPPRTLSGGILRAAAVFWFLVALAGQWLFFSYIIALYGTSTITGNLEVWNRLEVLGRTPFVPGDAGGNAAYAAHALGAGIIAFGGALQLIPQIRERFPMFHRWNGRLFLVTVTALSFSGFYLVWIRNTGPSFIDGLSTSINGVLILSFAAMTLRAALARNFDVHPRWAMRLYLVSNAQWFLRIGVFGYLVVGQLLGRQANFSDPFVRLWTFGCYLVPLAVLQLYFIARDRGGALSRVCMALGLTVLTLLMSAGIFAFSMFSYAIAFGATLPLQPD
jgi:hypothetical protein